MSEIIRPVFCATFFLQPMHKLMLAKNSIGVLSVQKELIKHKSMKEGESLVSNNKL
jgi:hypothetical protein